MERRRPEQSRDLPALASALRSGGHDARRAQALCSWSRSDLAASRPAALGTFSESRRRIPDSDDSSADRLDVGGARSVWKAFHGTGDASRMPAPEGDEPGRADGAFCLHICRHTVIRCRGADI